MKDKLIIVSGGMDSITLLHLKKEEIKLAVSFDYGQKHNKELHYALDNCNSLGIPWISINLERITPYLKSGLLKGGEAIPEGHYEDQIMKKTVVPFRNGIMLSIAAGIAESNDCSSVLIANHAGDHAIYPDCRVPFISAMKDAMLMGTYSQVKLEAPFTFMTKRDIGLLGMSIGVDFSRTWSCYKGGDIHCGKCGTCTERKEALEGFDPTEYEVSK
jgi:7-cyano-7-deazaguanine synthase